MTFTFMVVPSHRKIKKEKNWVTPPKKECKDTQDFQDDYKLDLFAAISSEEVSKENILGPFYMDPDRTVGKSHAQFEMTIRRLVFDEKQAEPKSNVELGTWKTGFIERELISTSGHEEDWKAHIALTVFRIVTHVVRLLFLNVVMGECVYEWIFSTKSC